MVSATSHVDINSLTHDSYKSYIIMRQALYKCDVQKLLPVNLYVFVDMLSGVKIQSFLHEYPRYYTRPKLLISRISYKCRWGLTEFYPTKLKSFDVATSLYGRLFR